MRGGANWRGGDKWKKYGSIYCIRSCKNSMQGLVDSNANAIMY